MASNGTMKTSIKALELWELPPPPSKDRALQDSRFVDYMAKEDDHGVILLAAAGWTTKAIAHHCGLSEGQVMYRISNSPFKNLRSDYRNGRSGFSRLLVRSGIREVANLVDKTLRIEERRESKVIDV